MHFETFTKRKNKTEKVGSPDVFQYDDLPDALRVQVVHIWRSTIGSFGYGQYRTELAANEVWTVIHDRLARELGVFDLVEGRGNAQERCERFLQAGSFDGALDIIELSFRLIDKYVRNMEPWKLQAAGATQDADSAIEELNHRFREHSIGYQFAGGQLVKVDSEYVHSEVVQPALSLLHDAKFKGPEEEFLKAHEHYRHGRHKEAITEALKAFESTLKAICDKRKWPYSAGAGAKDLIQVVFDNGLVPTPLLSQFTSLRAILESGLPTVRNKMSGHGQGSQTLTVPDYLSAYALHTAAANIVLLVEAYRATS
ncbi:MAG: hypothetical protein IIC91_00220 [Chloroflexi bacterium]|nr:hypothetical protein [Chloroflexota bacterium]